MNDPKYAALALVQDDLEDIEKELERNLTPYLDVVKEAASHILFSGGKRLRPMLMVLSARICDYSGKYDKTFSIVFEYLHAASLLHDDLVDQATLRRSKPVANLIYGNSIAVLVGDFLLARVLSIAAKTGHMEIIRVIGEITENMSQGEIHQLINKGRLDLSEKEYMDVIRCKTAVLIEGACRTGAMLSNGSKEKENALADYGLSIGLAFQMADDLLDYTSDTKALGKEIGADLKEGKLTLPVVYALQKADSKDRILMENIIKNESFSMRDFETLKKLLVKYDGIDYTKRLATEHITKAKEAISIFKQSETKELLISLADYALSRKS
jgi:octaprenyl-diphosphate synthase